MSQPRPKVRRDEFAVHVETGEGGSQWFSATQCVGRAMPFDKPRATAAVRVFDNGVVAWSVLLVTNRQQERIASSTVKMPKGPLTRLAMRAGEVAGIGEDPAVIHVERAVEVDGKFVNHLYKLSMSVSDAGVVNLDLVDGPDDGTFALGKDAERITVFLTSPTSGRTLAIGFIGHIGKPGTDDTIVRAAGKAMNVLVGQTEFQVLTGFEAVNVPPPPGASFAKPVRVAERVAFTVPVYLFHGDPNAPEMLARGHVGVELDLENANPQAGRLLFKAVVPSPELEAHMGDLRPVVERAVNAQLKAHLGEEDLQSITLDIVLGEVDDRSAGRLAEAVAPLAAGLDVLGDIHRIHDEG